MALRPEQSDGYLFAGVTQIEWHVNTLKTPCLIKISFRFQGQVIRCSVPKSFWEHCGGEIEAVLGGALHGSVNNFTIHASGYRTELGQYQELVLVCLEQG